MTPPCPHCGEDGAYEYASRAIFFSAISGTAFRASKLPAEKLAALRDAALAGHRPAKIAREVGVQYKTAWLAVQRVRAEASNV